jgi:formylglycine-generating enzyme required for sulfatase activity
MGGNVWQWCEDWYDATKTGRVLRGASWGETARANLLASSRGTIPGGSGVVSGFVVLWRLSLRGETGLFPLLFYLFVF